FVLLAALPSSRSSPPFPYTTLFRSVCTLRLLFGVFYWPVNYGSGALAVPSRDFLIATIVSSLPGQLSLVAIGAFIADSNLLHGIDRKSTRLNSSHVSISYAVFCLKK